MNTTFQPGAGLIVVPTRLWGPSGDTVARLALDTGATRSLMATAVLFAIGYDPALVEGRTRVTTGSGLEFVPEVSVREIEALSQTLHNFPLLCHTLPPTAGVDGLLGLDFFCGKVLSIDFVRGRVTLD